MRRRIHGRRLIALAAAAAALAGCSEDGTGPDDGGAPSITFPLAVGNTWTYETSTETGRAPSVVEETWRLIGTEVVDGDTYYELEDDGGGEVDTALVRQRGDEILVYPPRDAEGGDDAWLNRATEASLPWRFADFAASAGASWTLVDAETTITVGKQTGRVRFSVTGSSLGRTSVTVPAGSFSDAYQGELESSVQIGTEMIYQSTQTLWIADGVGIVKEMTTTIEEGDDEPVTETVTVELTTYDLP